MVNDFQIEISPKESPGQKLPSGQSLLVQGHLKTVTERTEMTSSHISSSDQIAKDLKDGTEMAKIIEQTNRENKKIANNPIFSEAKTVPSHNKKVGDSLKQPNQVSEFNKRETSSNITFVSPTDSPAEREKKEKERIQQRDKQQEERFKLWSKYNQPKGKIMFIPEEGIVLEEGINNFQFTFRGKFSDKLASLPDDKLFKEIKSILKRDDAKKYKLEQVSTTIGSSKEYKYLLSCDKERVISSYSKDRNNSRRNLLNAILKAFEIDRINKA